MSKDQSTMQCVILAGGLATRMRPLTDTIPKSLIPVNGRPFIDYQLRWLETQGVQEVVLCIGHQGERIRSHLANRKGPLQLSFVDEGEVLMGTGGALRLVLNAGLLHESFLVTYGDSFLPIAFDDVLRHFKQTQELALMTVFRNQGKWDSSNASYENGRVTLYDKRKDVVRETAIAMDFIDYGLSAFQREAVVKYIPSGEKLDLSNLFHSMSVRGELAGLEVDTRFYEIGSPEGLTDFARFAERELGSLFTESAIGPKVKETLIERSRTL